jgi:hypothetical protein
MTMTTTPTDLILTEPIKDKITVVTLWPPYMSANKFTLALLPREVAIQAISSLKSLPKDDYYLHANESVLVLGEAILHNVEKRSVVSHEYVAAPSYRLSDALRWTSDFRNPQRVALAEHAAAQAHQDTIANKKKELEDMKAAAFQHELQLENMRATQRPDPTQEPRWFK